MATMSLKQLEKMNAPKAAKKPSYNKTATINKTNAINAKVGKAAAVNKVANTSGMKTSAVKRAAEAGSRLGYNNPAYKDLIGRISEGDKKLEKSYTKTLQNARMKSKKKVK